MATTSPSLTFTVVVLAEQAAQRPHHVAGGELSRGHLVQQRLELVVRVLVDQRDRHAGVAEVLRAGDAGEAGADHDHVGGGAWPQSKTCPCSYRSAAPAASVSAATLPRVKNPSYPWQRSTYSVISSE